MFLGAGVEERHGVANPLNEDVSQRSTAWRMERYEREALPMGAEALSRALANEGIDAEELGMLTVVSCTGYATPGLDLQLAAKLGAAPDLQRVFVGHMGCYAAIPGLGVAADYVRAKRRPAALVSVELTSLHLQPSPLDTEQAVSHALFSDAAAAAVLMPAPAPGFEVRDITARTDLSHTDAMTWHVTDHGFRMGLSPRVPHVLARHLPDSVSDMLRRHDLDLADIDGWAVHPGGPKILQVAAESLGLEHAQLAASRDTLRHHGNCSSATILLVLRQLLRDSRPANIVATAFGPGLTLYTALLSSSDQ